MILYDESNFVDWLTCQPEWQNFPHKITIAKLHSLFIRFKEVCEDDRDALEHEFYLRSLENTLAEIRKSDAANAARERTARQNASDAVTAEVEATKQEID